MAVLKGIDHYWKYVYFSPGGLNKWKIGGSACLKVGPLLSLYTHQTRGTLRNRHTPMVLDGLEYLVLKGGSFLTLKCMTVCYSCQGIQALKFGRISEAAASRLRQNT